MNQEFTECDGRANAKDKVDQEQPWESAERTFHLGILAQCVQSQVHNLNLSWEIRATAWFSKSDLTMWD